MQPPSDTTPPSDNLQFDRAEYSAGPAALGSAVCALCQNALRDRYYDINGQPACVACRERTIADLRRGSALGRALKAVALGLVAALIGAAVYFGISAITGYEIALVAIVLGLFVGIAVRIGSNGRGGWFYQLLAVLLTYFAISVAYSSRIIYDMAKNPESLRGATESGVASQPSADAITASSSSSPASMSSSDDTQGPSSGSDETFPASQSLQQSWSGATPGEKAAVIGVTAVYVAALLFALPVLMSMQQPIGFLIIGVALWQAWRTNKGAKVRIAGPFAVAGPAPPTAPTALPRQDPSDA
jgi:hypothetical protein